MLQSGSKPAADGVERRDPEQLILQQLRGGRPCTVEEILERVPELTWAQLFLAVDILSRRGDVELSRQGFTYSVRMRPGSAGGGNANGSARPDHR